MTTTMELCSKFNFQVYTNKTTSIYQLKHVVLLHFRNHSNEHRNRLILPFHLYSIRLIHAKICQWMQENT